MRDQGGQWRKHERKHEIREENREDNEKRGDDRINREDKQGRQ